MVKVRLEQSSVDLEDVGYKGSKCAEVAVFIPSHQSSFSSTNQHLVILDSNFSLKPSYQTSLVTLCC